MALSKPKQKKLEILVSKGGMSDRAIAKEIGCDPKTVRNYIEKLSLEKSSLSSLAKAEIENIIIGNEIEEKKSSLSPHQKSAYSEVLITEAQSKNLSMNANHLLLEKIYEDIEDGTKDTKVNVGEGVQNIKPIRYEPSDRVHQAKAIQVITDSLGITDRFAPKQDIQVNQQQNNIDNEITITRIGNK